MDQYYVIRQLNNTHENWRIKIRVTRIWDAINPKKENQIMGLAMTFLDENYEHIYAIAYGAKEAARLRRELTLGNLYFITNFAVSKVVKSYRVVSNEWFITMKSVTSVMDVPVRDNLIKQHKFEFVSFDQVGQRLDDNTYLTDVLGRITNIDSISFLKTRFGRKEIRKLEIEDEEGRTIEITLWESAAHLIAEHDIHSSTDPVVLVVTSTTVGKYKGEYTLSSTFSTKIYKNLDIPEATVILNSVQARQSENAENNTSKQGLGSSKKWYLKNQCTIAQLKEIIKEGTSQPKKYTCSATLEVVDMKYNWYYMACPSHNKKVIEVHGGYRCDDCDTVIQLAVPRYKLTVLVSDDTGEAYFVLFQDQANQILNYPIEQLYDLSNEEKGSQKVEHVLDRLLFTPFIFEVNVRSYNLQNKFDRLTVTRLIEAQTICNSSDNIACIETSEIGESNDRSIIEDEEFPESAQNIGVKEFGCLTDNLDEDNGHETQGKKQCDGMFEAEDAALPDSAITRMIDVAYRITEFLKEAEQPNKAKENK